MTEVPAGFEPLFRTSPFLEMLGPFLGRGHCSDCDGGEPRPRDNAASATVDEILSALHERIVVGSLG